MPPKIKRHQRAAEDDDVVWHREIRRRKIDKERWGVHSLRDTASTQRRIRAERDWEENGGGKVPAPHGIRGMFSVLYKRLAEIDGETKRALGRDRQRRLQCRWPVVSVREEKR